VRLGERLGSMLREGMREGDKLGANDKLGVSLGRPLG